MFFSGTSADTRREQGKDLSAAAQMCLLALPSSAAPPQHARWAHIYDPWHSHLQKLAPQHETQLPTWRIGSDVDVLSNCLKCAVQRLLCEGLPTQRLGGGRAHNRLGCHATICHSSLLDNPASCTRAPNVLSRHTLGKQCLLHFETLPSQRKLGCGLRQGEWCSQARWQQEKSFRPSRSTVTRDWGTSGQWSKAEQCCSSRQHLGELSQQFCAARNCHCTPSSAVLSRLCSPSACLRALGTTATLPLKTATLSSPEHFIIAYLCHNRTQSLILMLTASKHHLQPAPSGSACQH